jgi:chain length determinant protein (polysaccharide antigen chain regulator)
MPKKKGSSDVSYITFETNDAEKSQYWLNLFVNYLSEKTRNELFDEVNYQLDNDRKSLQEQVQGKRALAMQRREDRLAELNESFIIAESIGLTEPMINDSANKLNMEYMRGSKAIKAEMSVLRARESDDPFIAGIRDIQEQIAYFDSIKLNKTDIEVVKIDQPAFIADQPIKPKKTLIVAVASVLGLMLGVFIALIRQAVQKRKAS